MISGSLISGCKPKGPPVSPEPPRGVPAWEVSIVHVFVAYSVIDGQNDLFPGVLTEDCNHRSVCRIRDMFLT